MFTGIIESLGFIEKIGVEGTNKHFTIQSDITTDLKIDQSVAHNGVCLTVVGVSDHTYQVTAIEETLQKTNLNDLKTGDWVNLERSMLMNGRIDGHIVQGHIDQIGICTQIETIDGSWSYQFQYDFTLGNITVEKGSICVNGVSLTVVNSQKNTFSVAIIPYTYQHTNFKSLAVGESVNLEFDVIGKYVQRILQLQR
jgi:riboflavin synthase